MTRIFQLDDVEVLLAKRAIEAHLTLCPKGISTHVFATYEEQCSPSSTFRYEFTPTGIGDSITVRCLLCGWYQGICNPDGNW